MIQDIIEKKMHSDRCYYLQLVLFVSFYLHCLSDIKHRMTQTALIASPRMHLKYIIRDSYIETPHGDQK